MNTVKNELVFTKDQAKKVIEDHVSRLKPLPIAIDLASLQHRIFREAFIEIELELYEGCSPEEIETIESFITSQGLNAV